DAFPLAFGLHRSPDFWLTEWNATPTRAHNEIVQVLATQGILGLLALAAVAISTVISLRRAASAGPDRALVLALGASLLAFVIHSLFSFTVAATGSLTAILVGIASCLAPQRHECVAPNVEATAGNWWVSFRFPVAATVIVVGCAAVVLAWVGVVRPLIADI